MKKEFIWDSDWELLVLSAFRWELQSKEEHKVSDFIKENTDRFTPKGLHNALQDCIDVLPIDKEWKPNVNKEPMRKYLEKHQKSFFRRME